MRCEKCGTLAPDEPYGWAVLGSKLLCDRCGEPETRRNTGREILAQLIQERLEFCGCGYRDAVLGLLRTAMRRLNKNGYEKGWYDAAVTELGGEAQAYLVWYLLDREGWTEHGSSVPGWLTVEGEEMLEKLERLGELE